MLRGVWRRYWRLFWRSFFERRATPKLHRRGLVPCAVFLIGYPLVEGFHLLFGLCDYLIPGWNHPEELQPPVFIIGNPRSGTTIAHRVLSRDSERFFHFLAWEIGFPSLCEKWIFAALGRVDSVLGGPWRRFTNWYTRAALGEYSKLHQTGLFLPEEDDKLLVHILACLDLAVFFPYADFQRWGRMDESVPPDEQDCAMNFYKSCVLRQARYKGGGRTLLSKNPMFTGKIRALRRNFPDCKLIYLVRNPLDVVPSAISMARTMIRVAFSQETGPDLDQDVFQLVSGYYRYALEELRSLPQNQVTVVKYDDLVRDPRATFDRIYEQFGWTASESFELALAEETQRMKSHRSEHRYSLDDCAISKDQIREELAVVFHEYGFDLRTDTAQDRSSLIARP